GTSSWDANHGELPWPFSCPPPLLRSAFVRRLSLLRHTTPPCASWKAWMTPGSRCCSTRLRQRRIDGMKTFTDDKGNSWTAGALEEDTPRHHGRWYLVFEGADGVVLPMPEVRWQTAATAERT